MKFVIRHLDVLETTLNDEYSWKGQNAKNWAKNFLRESQINDSLDRIFSKDDLLNSETFMHLKDQEIAIIILSWGKMKTPNGKLLFSKTSSWIQGIRLLREGKFNSREEAYNYFYTLDNSGLLAGMRPAFYTKLIFFLDRTLSGFIMDQWTSKSINLLLGHDLIKLDSQGYVDSKNNNSVYEEYCSTLEELAKMLKVNPVNLEEVLFSDGNGKGAWRNYINAEYKITKKVISKSMNDIKKIFPLSGKGKEICYTKNSNGSFDIKWGDYQFKVAKKTLNKILDKFFLDYRRWYPLGSHETNPMPDGLGKFMENLDDTNLNPRHASAIAAILVNEGILLSKGKKPILLSES